MRKTYTKENALLISQGTATSKPLTTLTQLRTEVNKTDCDGLAENVPMIGIHQKGAHQNQG